MTRRRRHTHTQRRDMLLFFFCFSLLNVVLYSSKIFLLLLCLARLLPSTLLISVRFYYILINKISYANCSQSLTHATSTHAHARTDTHTHEWGTHTQQLVNSATLTKNIFYLCVCVAYVKQFLLLIPLHIVCTHSAS